MTDMTNIFVTHKRASFRIFAAAALLFAVLLIFAAPAAAEADVWNGTIASGFAGGSGSESEPYIIKTGEQLAYLASKVVPGYTLKGYYRLESDIDLNNLNWTPIGGYLDYDDKTPKYFGGTFDGNGHTIYNLSINNDSKVSVGLFGRISSGVIKNLSIQNADVIGYSYIGGIVGYNYLGSVENCNVTNATITGKKDASYCACGGIIGYNTMGSSIKNCTVTNATLSGHSYVGGISGGNLRVPNSDLACNISGCKVENVSIVSTNGGSNFGGVVGFCYPSIKSIIDDCCVSNVEINGSVCGGVAGHMVCTSITNCTVDNLIINGTGGMGGIVGQNNDGNNLIENCMVAGLNITSSTSGGAGGINGITSNNLSITNCVVTGFINCGNNGNVGGVIGSVSDNYITIENCFVLLKEMAGNNIYHISYDGNNVTLKNNTVWVGLSDEPRETDAGTNTTYAYVEDFWNNSTFFSTLGDKWEFKTYDPIPSLKSHPRPKSKPAYLYQTLTLDYKANDGNGNVPKSNHRYYAVNEPERLDTGSGLSKDGYTFTGWNTKADGTGVSYEKGDVIKLTESVTLYAQYIQNAGYVLVLPDSITLIQKSNGYAEATENISLRITVNKTHAQNLTVSVKSNNTWKLINGAENIAYTLNVTDWQNKIHNSSASSETMSGILTLYPNTLTEELNSEYNSTLYFKTSAPPEFGKTFTDTLTFTVESETIQRTSVST